MGENQEGKASKAKFLVGVCSRPPNQDEAADELFDKCLADVSQSLRHVLVGGFNLPDVSWKLQQRRGGSPGVCRRELPDITGK